MTVPLDALLGPLGLTAFLLLVVGALARQLLKSYERQIADLLSERERMEGRLVETTTVLGRLADAVEKLVDRKS